MAHDISLDEALRTEIDYDGARYRVNFGDGLRVTGTNGLNEGVGPCARAEGTRLRVQFTPGCENYFQARADRGSPFVERDIAAAVVVTVLAGHPDAEKDRAGVTPSAVWSHHLAIVGGEDPRRIATTYAPTETKRISHRVQHMVALGIEINPDG